MSRVVFRYAVPIGAPYTEPTYVPTRPIHVAADGTGQVLVWCEVPHHTAAPDEQTKVKVYGTGHPIPDGAVHIGTTLERFAGGELLEWHLYDVTGCL